MTFDLGFLTLHLTLTGQSDPWYGPFVVGIPLGLLGVFVYYSFFDR